MRILKFVLAALVLFSLGCDEDFEVFAPYKSVPVVYGSLNAGDDQHFIRISKIFRGEGNNLEYAEIADSSFAEVDSVKVELLNQNGEVTKVHQLTRTTLPPKEEGDFFTEPNTAFTFTETNLGGYAEYRLSFLFEGRRLSAQVLGVPELGQGAVSRPFFNATNKIKFINSDISAGDEPEFVDYSVEFRPAVNVRQYKVFYIFNYREVYLDGTEEIKRIPFQMYSQVFPDLTGRFESPRAFQYKVAGVYESLVNRLGSSENVDFREILPGSFEFTGLSEDFYVYDQAVNGNVGIGQEIINYTNVYFDDGEPAIGVFSSASTTTLSSDYNNRSEYGFLLLPETRNLKFCSSNPDVITTRPDLTCN